MREFAIALERAKTAHDRDLRIAWYVAALSRAKTLPPLADLLRLGRPQSALERAAVWRRAADIFGGTIRPHDPARVRIVRSIH